MRPTARPAATCSAGTCSAGRTPRREVPDLHLPQVRRQAPGLEHQQARALAHDHRVRPVQPEPGHQRACGAVSTRTQVARLEALARTLLAPRFGNAPQDPHVTEMAALVLGLLWPHGRVQSQGPRLLAVELVAEAAELHARQCSEIGIHFEALLERLADVPPPPVAFVDEEITGRVEDTDGWTTLYPPTLKRDGEGGSG